MQTQPQKDPAVAGILAQRGALIRLFQPVLFARQRIDPVHHFKVVNDFPYSGGFSVKDCFRSLFRHWIAGL
jgi:hypothetical protein